MNERRTPMLPTLNIVPIEDVTSKLQLELPSTEGGSLSMVSDRRQALADFRRILKWIVLIAILMVAGALTYLYMFSTLDVSTVIAVTVGVFFSVLLGCSLFAAAFFSNKSGIDEQVTNLTRSETDKR